MTVLVGISVWGLALLTPAGSYPISYQKCHTAHTFNLKVVSLRVLRENRRKPRFVMFK